VLIDIDADFFVQVPHDLVWVQPAQVVKALKALNRGEPPAFDLTIARSVGTGFLPLQHRFLADFLAALWEDRLDDAIHWQHLLDEEINWRNGRRQQALAGLKEAVLRRPLCAASCYALGHVELDTLTRDSLFEHAAALDPAYADDLVRRLGEVSARRKHIDIAAVSAIRCEVVAFHDSAEREATAWVALGLLCASIGCLDEALDCDMQSRRYVGGHPELALELAKLWIGRREFHAAEALLLRSAMDDETRVLAWFNLAECAFAQNNFAGARHLAMKAHVAAPAWASALERLAAYAEAEGDVDSRRKLIGQWEDLNSRITKVIARLEVSALSVQ
jgi:hypothetical protein